ncbi:MAG: hypothetical protein US69_C0027G0005 [candidate division TM6 bacterium GW2011_GWF2_38_10]|nr:MAG: hypothetical protein US69_C0027G0005 [candidate division TM6 bacterium GW2011_GWF2_38_10]
MYALYYLFFILFLIPTQSIHSMIPQKTMHHSKSNSSLYTLDGHYRSLQEQCTELKIRMHTLAQHPAKLQYEKMLLLIDAQLQEASLYIYDVLTYKDIHPRGRKALDQNQYNMITIVQKKLIHIQERLDTIETAMN